MSTGKKIAWGLGIAGGALLAAWLLTGDRKKKTKDFIGKQAKNLKDALGSEKPKEADGSEAHYI
jgi:hypothetical protein